MRKILFILILAFTSLSFAQHGGGRRGGYSQQQTDPTKVPKIGVVYGTVVDSTSGTPIPYASVAIVNSRSSTIMTGGITNQDGEFHIKEIALGRHKIVVEYIGLKSRNWGHILLCHSGIIKRNITWKQLYWYKQPCKWRAWMLKENVHYLFKQLKNVFLM